MIFLIHYDRRAQVLLRFDKYDDADRPRAEADMTQLELSLLASDRENEVGLFKGIDEAALRVSHARYFNSLTDLTAGIPAHGPFAC